MQNNIIQNLPDVKKDVLLKDFTTYKIGGPAKYFYAATTGQDVQKALTVARENSLPILVLGGGSNLLVADEGFDGLVVQIKNDNEIIYDSENLTITAGAGVTMAKLVEFSINHSLMGLEWAGGLPGTFGGAVRGNAGAFAGEMKDNVIEVACLDENLNIKKLSCSECDFGYRSSIFKSKNYIVLSATLKFKKGNQKELEEICNSHMLYRKEKQPLEYPNAGSVFQNCPLADFSPALKSELSHVVKSDPFPVVPTAFLISEAGLKGTKIGGAQISEKHPNFIINLGGAKAEDVVNLIKMVKMKVKEKFNVEVVPEVQFVNIKQ